MNNPTIKGNYTKEQVRDYAYYRKASAIYAIEQLFKDERIKNGEIAPEDHEEYREPLSLVKNTVVTIELSTGGDADGFMITFDQNKEITKGLYYWADWGVYEEVSLSQDDLDLIDALYCVTDWIQS